jgi:hypothetical protein
MQLAPLLGFFLFFTLVEVLLFYVNVSARLPPTVDLPQHIVRQNSSEYVQQQNSSLYVQQNSSEYVQQQSLYGQQHNTNHEKIKIGKTKTPKGTNTTLPKRQKAPSRTEKERLVSLYKSAAMQ